MSEIETAEVVSHQVKKYVPKECSVNYKLADDFQTPEKQALYNKLPGQARQVLDALQQMHLQGVPVVNKVDLANYMLPTLVTRQGPFSVITFYQSRFVKLELIEIVKTERIIDTVKPKRVKKPRKPTLSPDGFKEIDASAEAAEAEVLIGGDDSSY